MNVEIFYVHPDHLGTPRVITASAPLAATQGTGITSAQTVNKAVWRWDSDPFGSNATATSAPNENPNTLNQVVGASTLPYLFAFDTGFPGKKRDRETGKHYNYFRDYDPSIGRYTTSDPIGLRGGKNTFGYVNQQPQLKIDRYGLWETGSGGGGGGDGASGACKLIIQIPMHTNGPANLLGVKWWCIYLCKTATCPPSLYVHQRPSEWIYGCPDVLPLQPRIPVPD